MIRHAGRAVILLLVLLCLTVSGQETPNLPRPDFSDATTVSVVRVVDGDTVVLLLEGKPTTVRLIGVDTPETVHPEKPVEAYGREASAFLTNLLKGESVYLEYEPGGDRLDKYGRTLAYLYRAPDGLFVNLEIVRQGYGHAYTEFPFQHMEAFRFYERRAREAEKGLWAPEAVEEPLPEGLSLESIPGVYRRFEDGKVTGILTLYPDHTFKSGSKQIPQYQWELTPEGLVIGYYSARWLFRPAGSTGFVGEYTGPDEKLVGKKAWLLRGASAAFTQPKARQAAPAAAQHDDGAGAEPRSTEEMVGETLLLVRQLVQRSGISAEDSVRLWASPLARQDIGHFLALEQDARNPRLTLRRRMQAAKRAREIRELIGETQVSQETLEFVLRTLLQQAGGGIEEASTTTPGPESVSED